MTAHGELQGQEPAQMETRTFPESSIYRKLRAGEFKARGGKWGLPPLTKRDSNDNHESCFAEGVRPHFPVRPLNSSSHSPGPLEQFEQRARECANSGDYAGAEQWCQRALGEDPFAVRIYYLLAKIAEEQKEEDRTKDLLKKALYLDPDYVPAYVDLAEAYDRENDSKRARKLRLCAIECLRRMNSDAAADIYEGTTPAELMLTLEAMVNGEASDGR